MALDGRYLLLKLEISGLLGHMFILYQAGYAVGSVSLGKNTNSL